MTEENQKDKISFKEFLASIVWVFKIFWKINPLLLITAIITSSVVELIFLTNSYIFAKIIDVLTKMPDSGNLMPVVYILLLSGGVNLFGLVVRDVERYSFRQLRTTTNPKYLLLLYQKLRFLGIQSLEKPGINNLTERSRQNWYHLVDQLQYLTDVVAIVVGIISSFVVLVLILPKYIIVVVLATIPAVLVDRYYQKKMWKLDLKVTEQQRAGYDSVSRLVNPNQLHELIVTQGYTILQKNFQDYLDIWLVPLTKYRQRSYSFGLITRIIRLCAELGGYWLIILKFLAHEITIGSVTFYIRILGNFSGNINGLTSSISASYESALRINEMRGLFDLEPPFPDGNIKIDKLKSGPQIKLQNVSFSYPESKNVVISDLSLDIKPGEKIAIVGHNGAGKTTLVKLICRFYKVTSGEIIVNNQNINNLKIDSWYKNVGVLFQDYNTYGHLDAKTNISIGNPLKKPSHKSITRAARRADAFNFIKSYDKGFDQILSEKYKGGVRPSTGQWQKIAIARFFYRNAPLLIFDEPTAAIDAVSEKKIFNKIYKFFKGKTVIIISHRFSTVRNADRIIVFEKGHIVEEGSHESLMKKDGVYAHSFKLQAEGYSK